MGHRVPQRNPAAGPFRRAAKAPKPPAMPCPIPIDATPRRARRGALLLVAAIAGLAGCADSPAADGPAVLRPGSPDALARLLPAAAGGLRRGAESPLESGGREVSYATAGRTAAAVVELLPAAAAPGGHAQFVAQSADGGGPHRRLREVGTSFREGPLQCAQLEGSYGRHQPVRSLVCSGDAGAATRVRLRVSMPRRDPPAADARAFAREIAAALR